MKITGIEAFDYGKEEKFHPKRVHSIIVTKSGYYPKSLSLFRGEKLKLYVTGTEDTPGCLMFAEQKLFLAAAKGEVAEGELFFPKAGIYKFYCPTGKITGQVVVLERKKEVDKRKREIASKNIVKIWRPREE